MFLEPNCSTAKSRFNLSSFNSFQQDPPPSTAEYSISAYNSPLSQPVIKLQRVPGRSKNTPVLSSLDSAVNGHVHVQSRIRKESNTSMPPLKMSKVTFCVGKENEPVLSSKKSKVSSCFEEENKVKKTSKVTQALHPCVQKENDQAQLPTRKRSKPSAEVSCSSESPSKKQKQVFKIDSNVSIKVSKLSIQTLYKLCIIF